MIESIWQLHDQSDATFDTAKMSWHINAHWANGREMRPILSPNDSRRDRSPSNLVVPAQAGIPQLRNEPAQVVVTEQLPFCVANYWFRACAGMTGAGVATEDQCKLQSPKHSQIAFNCPLISLVVDTSLSSHKRNVESFVRLKQSVTRPMSTWRVPRRNSRTAF